MSVRSMTEMSPNPKYMSGLINYFASINLSIRSKILLSFFVIILAMSMVDAILIVQVLRFNRQYDTIITNITTANSINGYIKPAIDSEMWSIVAGKTDFDQGQQYQIIDKVNSQIHWMMANTDSEKGRIKLEVILRTMETLTLYVDKMGEQIENGSKVTENEQILENIRGVSDLVHDLIQEYILFEVNRTETSYRETQQAFSQWAFTYTILLFGVVIFSVLAAWIISESIYVPIKKLHDVTTTITENDLQVLVTSENANEIAELGLSFNIMIGKIKEMLDSKVKEQENLKKAEFRALQAQINPHFLYNTLDTIVWMAEAKQNAQVIDIVSALSRFFRISLSKGKDWITIQEEIERTRSYLTIQKIRYRDILDYTIEADETVLKGTTLKLILQPLVENAIYHGIKNKRGGGTVTVRAYRQSREKILFEVEDNGIGMTAYRLHTVQSKLDGTPHEFNLDSDETGFGLENVNQRIKLYYGQEYGLSIQSTYNEGTRVMLVIPMKEC
ncbi:MAG: sensor histidine kinase [Anaerolineae bacterium]|nr:sensor histidine kinase [Anaerolineae bacterium]